jgi:hypothetical protein
VGLYNGGYCFYIAGVDRTYSLGVSIVNGMFGAVFNGADDLWSSIKNGMVSHVNSMYANGSANLK